MQFKSRLAYRLIMFIVYTIVMLYGFVILGFESKLLIISIWIIATLFYYRITDNNTTNVIVESDRLIFIKPLRLFGIKRICVTIDSIDRAEIRVQSFGMITLYFKNNKQKTIGLSFGLASKRKFIRILNDSLNNRVIVLGYYDKDITNEYK